MQSAHECETAQMDAPKSLQQLQHMRAMVQEFRSALERFLDLHELSNLEWPDNESFPAVVPREGTSVARIARLRSEVARAAGRAQGAVELTGGNWETGRGVAIDPIATWHTLVMPGSIMDPDDIFLSCDQILGRLDSLVDDATNLAPPTIGVASMHPMIWGAAESLWRTDHYRQAVAAAAEALMGLVKAMTGRPGIPDTALWQEAFSNNPPSVEKPRLRWPGDPTDTNVKNMNDGLRQFGPGVQMVIRNPAVHVTEQIGQQDGLEKLATLSLLARWVNQCDLLLAPPEN